ncbi:MAG: segregation/condensation protein A [Actinobacteria bacterium]|nr:segregation/condensation protein A [Actinomycetota bacterium]
MSYEVKLEVFEGPFDLLIGLIAKQKVDIYDVPIAKITDEYLAYVKAMHELDLEVATEFLLVATALLDIKTSTLLPMESAPAPDEEISADEIRENLIARLLEYKKFKSVAVVLGTRYLAEGKFYMREVEIDEEFATALPELILDADAQLLCYLYDELTSRPPAILDAEHITPEPLRVDAFVVTIRGRLDIKGRQSFRELTRDCRTKAEVIASFLAILELYKRGMVELGQAETFGEIEIELVVEEVLAV